MTKGDCCSSREARGDSLLRSKPAFLVRLLSLVSPPRLTPAFAVVAQRHKECSRSFLSRLSPTLASPDCAHCARSERFVRERQKVGGQAALRSGSFVCGCDLNFGYQWRNRSSRSSLRTLVLVCSKRWVPRSVHCICCFLTNRLLTTWLMADSTNAVLIVSPCRRRSPKFGMNSRLLQMYVLNSSRPSTSFFAAFERA